MMKYLIILFTLLVSACRLPNKNGNASIRDTITFDSKILTDKIRDSLFNLETILIHENYTLKIITTCQRDSVLKEEMNLFNPIVISQTFKFYKGNIIHDSISLPIRMIEQRVCGVKKMKMLDCVFFNVKLIQRKDKSIVYHMIAYGGCNGNCPFCDAVFSIDGKLIAIDYRTVTQIIKQEGSSSYLSELTEGKIKGDILKDINFYP